MKLKESFPLHIEEDKQDRKLVYKNHKRGKYLYYHYKNIIKTHT